MYKLNYVYTARFATACKKIKGPAVGWVSGSYHRAVFRSYYVHHPEAPESQEVLHRTGFHDPVSVVPDVCYRTEFMDAIEFLTRIYREKY